MCRKKTLQLLKTSAMKTKMSSKNQIVNLLIAIFILALNSESFAQEEQTIDLKDFKIIIEKTDNGIRMQSLKGSAWLDLTFSINDYQPQAINEFGMTELDKKNSAKDPKLADFLFTITITEKGIILRGLEGTAWTDLSFSLAKNEKQAIDQFGLTNLN
jgi:hypothetical protein